MMNLDVRDLERFIFTETGLEFEAATGIDKDKRRWFELRPGGLSKDHTFSIRAVLDWRRIRITFEPGKFAGELLSSMGEADVTGRSAFSAILSDCIDRGASIDWKVNEMPYDVKAEEPWREAWYRFSLNLSKGQLHLGAKGEDPDVDAVFNWVGSFVAAITSILPLEPEVKSLGMEIAGYPEGALTTVLANKFERDRRNRAAAITIHGSSCLACGLDMGKRYGAVAEGYIEVHHITPVSEMDDGYIVDPAKDLVPLCPNCHSVAHRRKPPLSVEELRTLLKSD